MSLAGPSLKLKKKRNHMQAGCDRACEVDVARNGVLAVQVLGVRPLIIPVNKAVHVESLLGEEEIRVRYPCVVAPRRGKPDAYPRLRAVECNHSHVVGTVDR